jgi:hypothetical protein
MNTKCQSTTSELAEKLAGKAGSVRARLQSLLKNSLERQEVSGHDFSRAEERHP